ncbi:unnamed protein product [Candidula unifasciata]|uniref:Uncharacterized protein n=1 Tax=Candidula unifasciata TaxID=100452 RepID=A0A8S4A3Q2_9EUPU|nr:unnamed protein product [Candidula unifasciata]
MAAYNQPAPPYTGPSVSYFNPSAPYDYSQFNPYTINQPDPNFYALPPCGPMNSSSTTVVIQQPVPALGMNGRRSWSTGMCDCCKDMNICCCGTFCYCCMACQIATQLGESFCVPCFVPGWQTVLRTKMRLQHAISGSVMDDCLATTFCFPCTLCQLARELKLYTTRGQVMH